MSARQDLTIDAGRDYALSVKLYEADNTTPLNLLDTTLEWLISREGVVLLLAKNSEIPGEIDITDIAGGLATIHLDAADTEDLGANTLDHEMIIIDATGTEATVMRGLLTIQRTTATA